MRVDRPGIGLQKPRIPFVHPHLIHAAQPREPQPQHRPPAVKRGQAVGRAQEITRPHVAKTGIRGSQQIGRRICERAVQIKDHTGPALQHPAILGDSRPLGGTARPA